MTARTFNELFEPQLTLSLVTTPSGWSSVIDQHGQLYFPPVQDITVALRFMAAMAERKDAVIDDASVERATWHSVRVGALSEREERRPLGHSESRSESASKVVPIRAAYACHCKLWEQRWQPDTPEHCANCGGLFPAHTVDARRPMPGDPA